MKKTLNSFFCFYRPNNRASNLVLIEDSSLKKFISYRVEEVFLNDDDDLVTRCYFVSSEKEVAMSVFSVLKNFLKKNFV